VVPTKVRKITTDTVRVFEFGMSYLLKALLPEAFLINSHDKECLRFAFLHIVKHFCPRSYLLRDEVLPELTELSINLNVQVKRYERLAKVSIEALRPLAELYLVETKECELLSEMTEEMRVIFESLGVDADAIQI